MSYLLGSGWWIAWNVSLLLSVAPFVVMTAALTRASLNDPMPTMETAFGIGTVGLFVLMGFTAISGYFWTAGGTSPSLWAYLRNIAIAIVLAFLVGFVGVFGASYISVTPKQPMSTRWVAQLVCLASAVFLAWFCIHSAWRFRHR